MRDKWCGKLTLADGRTISGGAARNRRIAQGGGMEEIIFRVAQDVFEAASQVPGTMKMEHSSNVHYLPKRA